MIDDLWLNVLQDGLSLNEDTEEASDEEVFAIDLSNFGHHLETQGYRVWPQATRGGFAEAVRLEIETLHSRHALLPSENRLTTERNASGEIVGVETLAKTGVYELDLLFEGTSSPHLAACPAISHFIAHLGPMLAERLRQAYPKLCLTGIDQVKVQLNEGKGGCFMMHYDTSAAVSSRAVTALLYLNADYVPGEHGGELQLFPFPLAPVLVEPRHNTLAVFCSTELLHRVRPAYHRRVCLSVWFKSSESEKLWFPNKLPLLPPLTDSDKTLNNLFHNHQSRRLLAKVFYREEYAASFVEAFGNSSGVHKALQLDKVQTDKAAALVGVDLLKRMHEVLPLEPLPLLGMELEQKVQPGLERPIPISESFNKCLFCGF